MKKIIVSLSVIALVAGIAFGVTGAYFSDTETSTGNTLTADTLDLTIGLDPDNLGNDDVVMFNGSGINPGENGKETLHIRKNETDKIKRKTIKCSSLTEKENGRTEPEIESGDQTPNTGELAENLYVQVGEDTDGDGATDTVFEEGYLDELCNMDYIHMGDGWQKPADTKRIVVRWGIDDSVGNEIQSDSVEFGLEFGLIHKQAKYDNDPEPGMQTPPWE